MTAIIDRRSFLCRCGRYVSALSGTLIYGCSGGGGSDQALGQDDPIPLQTPGAGEYQPSNGISDATPAEVATTSATHDFACAGGSAGLSGADCGNHYSATTDAELNQFFSDSNEQLQTFFLSPASLLFFDECEGPNAFAPRNTAEVRFGIQMLNSVLTNFQGSRSPLLFILAHEYAHRLQFQFGWYQQVNGEVSVRIPELVADVLGSFFMFSQYPQYYASNENETVSILIQAFNLGSSNWQDPHHHGTQKQRAAAVLHGAQLAVEVTQGEVAYDWASIHTRAWNMVIFILDQAQYRKIGPARYYQGRVV